MTAIQIAQAATALFVVSTPLIVVRIAYRVAEAHARRMKQAVAPPPASIWLSRVTLGGLLLTSVVALAVAPQPSRLFLIAGLEFAALAALALKCLADIDRLTKPIREVSDSTRSASLIVRRAADYVPWTWRFALYAMCLTGVTAFLFRATGGPTAGRLFTPVSLAGAAMVFLWLYETWIQGLVADPAMADQGDDSGARRRSIRRVFSMEVALVTGCLAAAHVLLDLNWQIHGTFGAVVSISVGILGVVGCALALSSDLTRRHYVRVTKRPVT